MKILLFSNEGAHHKNTNALMHYRNIQFTNISSMNQVSNIEEYDCVLSVANPIDISNYPNTLFLFGPQFSVFPDHRLTHIKGPNCYYNLLSQWVVDCWNQYEISKEMHYVKLPFGVETDKFIETKPIQQREKVFVYFKTRDPNELHFLIEFLNKRNIQFVLFNYDTRYNENDYLQYLQEAKYGIWLGRHESQGFAVQEAMSCNVPLFVWDVKYMNQEVRTNYTAIPATCIPYWDERCGEFFYNGSDIDTTFEIFLSKIESYNPRQYILETLSMEVCEKRFIDFIVAAKDDI